MTQLQDERDGEGYGDERSRIYKAAGGSKRTPMLLLIPLPHYAEEDRIFPYIHIQQILLRKNGKTVVIELPYVSIFLTGQNLRAVALALGAHACSRLEAFDPARRDLPTNPDEPFIASIEYLVQKLDRKSDEKPPQAPARAVEKSG